MRPQTVGEEEEEERGDRARLTVYFAVAAGGEAACIEGPSVPADRP